MTSRSERFDRIDELIERLGEREERYRVILDASPWGILVVDQTFHIVFINRTMERISGYRVDELEGRHLHILIPEEVRKTHSKIERKYVAKPVERVGNHGYNPELLRKDGTKLAVEISLSPTRLYGQQLFFASIRPFETLYNSVGK